MTLPSGELLQYRNVIVRAGATLCVPAWDGQKVQRGSGLGIQLLYGLTLFS